MRRPGIGVARRAGWRGIGGSGPASAAPAAFNALTNFANAADWFRPDVGDITLIGSDADEWAGKSATGNVLVSGGVGMRPEYLATGGPLGTPCVRFDGGSEWMRDSTFTWGGTVGEYTLIMVAKQNAFVALDRWLDYNNMLYFRSGSTDVMQFTRGGVGSSQTTSAPGTTAWHWYVGRKDATNRTIAYDGTVQDTDADASGTLTDAQPLAIGGSSTGSVCAQIDVAEVVLVRAAASAPEIAAYAAYLTARYGL